jgi:hypothetical protein
MIINFAAGLFLANQLAFAQDLDMFGYRLTAALKMFGNGLGVMACKASKLIIARRVGSAMA